MMKPLRLLRQDIEIAAHKLRHGGSFALDGLVISIPGDTKRDIKLQIVSGEYEKAEIELARKWIDPTLPIVELGGCMGVLSAHLRRLLAPGVPLVVVEANPGLTETCKANAMRPAPEGPTNVMCAAVAYGVDHVHFHLNRNVHVSRIADTGKAANFRCPAVTLQKVVAQKLAENAPFTLVCDIEGCEYDVFEKDTAVLQRCAVAIVEVHPHMFDDSAAAEKRFLSLAASAGFSKQDQMGTVVVLKR